MNEQFGLLGHLDRVDAAVHTNAVDHRLDDVHLLANLCGNVRREENTCKLIGRLRLV